MGFGLLGAGVAGLAARQVPWSAYAADYRSTVGERRKVVLDDGTLLMLGGDSAVDIHYGPDARRVALRRGELYIETGHGPRAQGRPFIVTTDLGSIRALGTRYSVDRRRGDVAVAVYEGAVEIQPSQGRPMVLAAGQAASFTAAGAAPARTVSGQQPSWLNDQLVAERMRLADFLEQVGRYRRGVIRCHADVADLIVSGVYPLGDTDRILASLSAALPLRIARYTDYWIVIEKNPPRP
jgi:transmembrane sensor